MPATLKSRIPEITASLTPRTRAALRPGAEMIAIEAKERCPRTSGAGPHLQDAIHVEPDEAGWAVVAGNETVFYGHMVENGGAINRAPHPFLVPALESRKEAVVAEVVAALRRL